RAVCSADTTRRRYAAEEMPRSARLISGFAGNSANSVGSGSNCSAIRPKEFAPRIPLSSSGVRDGAASGSPYGFDEPSKPRNSVLFHFSDVPFAYSV
ncbi:hypothetical protein, partial [Streptomyces melanogenes]|uniref:hypothetical protein n=1 Tax=Streptomyces melanogenes TaxID=67326 RepID=UPI0037A820DB